MNHFAFKCSFYSLRNFTFSLCAVGAALLISACGGGSNSPALTISGIAATGSAIEGGSVSVQCVSGTGVTTTLGNGFYSVSITSGQGPCLVTVIKGDLVLRSIAANTKTGSSIANVTAFSDAIVTALVYAKRAVTPDALITNPALRSSNEDLSDSVAVVIVKINEALVALNQPTLDLKTDLLSQPNFVAASGTTEGDALDKALDALVGSSGKLSPDLIQKIIQIVGTVVEAPPTGAAG